MSTIRTTGAPSPTEPSNGAVGASASEQATPDTAPTPGPTPSQSRAAVPTPIAVGGTEGAPDLLTLAEAAAVLRIGRTVMYELARRCEADGAASNGLAKIGPGGTVGEIAVVRVGHQFRVPRSWLEARIGGPITWPPVSAATSGFAAPRPPDQAPSHNAASAPSAPRRTASSRRPRTVDSPSLFSV